MSQIEDVSTQSFLSQMSHYSYFWIIIPAFTYLNSACFCFVFLTRKISDEQISKQSSILVFVVIKTLLRKLLLIKKISVSVLIVWH